MSAIISQDLAGELSERHSVTVICPAPTRPLGFVFSEAGAAAEQKKYEKVIVKSYTCPQSKLIGRIYESYSFGKACVAYLRKHKEDIGLVYLNVWPLCAQYILAKAARKYKIPVIVHVQDIYPESLLKKISNHFLQKIVSKVFIPLDKKILDFADHVIVISENMRKHLRATRMICDDKMTTVSNWQDERDFLKCSDAGNTDDKITFMYLGNNGPVARVDWLIKCFCKAKLSNARLVIAGSGSRRQMCEELARSLSADNVVFADVPSGKVPETQSRADVMVLSLPPGAARSSIPSKIPAYMFSAKPILGALDLDSDTARAILESKGGVVTDPADEDAFVEVLQKFANMSKGMLQEMGAASRAYGLAHFARCANLAVLTKKVEKLYDENQKI